jgi:biotin synthase
MPLFAQAHELFEKSISRRIAAPDLDEIIAWPDDQLTLLFAAADQVRRHFFGNTVRPCGIMNVKSGACSEDCAFCSQSAHNHANVAVTGVSSAQEIRERFVEARDRGLDFCVVSSGRRLSPDEVRSIVAAVRACKGPVHASLGILDGPELESLAAAGVTCYNHNLETSRSFFPAICSTHDYDDRVRTVRAVKKAGMQACCGGIFGLGETWQDRKALCLEIMSLDINCIPVNFFNPIPGTRAQAPRETPLEFLKIVSLFRFANPDRIIKVAGGREANLKSLQPLIFMAGANSYISGGYLTTGGAGVDADRGMIADCGLRIESQKVQQE